MCRGGHWPSAVKTKKKQHAVANSQTQPGTNLHRRAAIGGDYTADERCSPLHARIGAGAWSRREMRTRLWWGRGWCVAYVIRTNRRGIIYPVGVELEESRSMTPKGPASRRTSTRREAPRSSEPVGADDHISPSRSALVGGFGFWNARRLCRRIRAGACGHAPLRNAPIP